ncbi:MAG: hypothetical protein AB7P22_19590 [Vicinamibacterales bacterium]
MRTRFLLFLICIAFATTAAADGPQLQNVGIGILDAITGIFRSYMRFMTGSFAPFVAVIGGTVALVALFWNAKEGLMATVLKFVGFAVGALSVPAVVVTIQGLL